MLKLLSIYLSIYRYLSYHSTFCEKQRFLIVHCSQTFKAIDLKIAGHYNLWLRIIFTKFKIHCMIGKLKILNFKIAFFAFSYCLYIMYLASKILQIFSILKLCFQTSSRGPSGLCCARGVAPRRQCSPGASPPGCRG